MKQDWALTSVAVVAAVSMLGWMFYVLMPLLVAFG